MSQFASFFVTAVVLISLISYLLLVWGTSKMKTGKKENEEMGHEWDGITELNSPLPKWWYWTFLGLTVWAIGFVFYYPALGNSKGIANWTAEKQYQEDVQATNAKYKEYFASINRGTLEEVAKNPEAIQTGKRLFLNNCSVCHGSDAAGAVGYPNLADNDWLYGGDAEVILQSITNGRTGLMPAQRDTLEAFAKSNNLDANTVVDDTVDYVLALAGKGESNPAGEKAFNGVCAACHTPAGTGMLALGAPNLTDNIWLYDTGEGSVDSLRHTILTSINDGRNGVMPAHKDILSEHKIKTLAAYIYSLSNK